MRGLGGDGLSHRRVGMAQVGGALPADAVDVFLAVASHRCAPSPRHDGDSGPLGVQAGSDIGFQVR